jgi:hypothetical protein
VVLLSPPLVVFIGTEWMMKAFEARVMSIRMKVGGENQYPNVHRGLTMHIV